MIIIDEAKKTELINEKAELDRQKAYREESDPLFFKWQRGEGTEQEYLNKIAEIRLRYPYV